MRKPFLSATLPLVSLLLLLASAPAGAADLGGNCCADLEERIAELEATTGRRGNRKVSLTITGFVGGQNQYVVIDTTSFGIEDRALRHIGSGISGAVNGAMNRPNSGVPGAPSGQMSLGAQPADPASGVGSAGNVPSATPSVWGAALGGRADLEDDDISDTGITFGGGIGGGHVRVAPGVVLGAFAGGASSRLDTERGKRIDADYLLGGIYGRAVFGPTFVDASLTGGRADSESKRGFITTAPGVSPFQTAHGEYDSAFVLPEVRVGTYVPLGGGAVLIPAASVRYQYQHFDAYQETGSTTDLAVGSRELQSFEERLELAIKQDFALASGQLASLHASAGAVFYQSAGDDTVDVRVLGVTASFSPGADGSDIGFVGRAGFDIGLVPGWSAFGEGETILSDGTEAFSGTAGIRAKF